MLNNDKCKVGSGVCKWIELIGGRFTLVGRKSWSFEEEGDGEEDGEEDASLALASQRLKDDLVEKVVEKKADIYEIFSILSHDSPYMAQMESLAGQEFATQVRIVWNYFYGLCCYFVEINRFGFNSCPVTFLKCWICAILQMSVAPLVVAYEINRVLTRRVGDGEDQYFEQCQMYEDDSVGKTVAFFFSLYIMVHFLRGSEDMNDPRNAATYLIFSRNRVQKSLGVSFVWGHTANILSHLFTAMVSLSLIYLSPNPMEMLLNALAMIFLSELDDALVTKNEYRKAEEVLKELGWIESEHGDDETTEHLIASDEDGGTEVVDEELAPKQTADDDGDLIVISNWFCPYKWIIIVLSVVVFVQVIGGPFYMVICYGSRGKGDDFEASIGQG